MRYPYTSQKNVEKSVRKLLTSEKVELWSVEINTSVWEYVFS